MVSQVFAERPLDPSDPVFGEGRFDDIALFLTALGFNATVAARSLSVTPLDPHHKCRWQIAVLSGNYQVLEQDRRSVEYVDYTTMRRDDLLGHDGMLLLGNAHPQDVTESFIRHLASRVYLRGPLLL